MRTRWNLLLLVLFLSGCTSSNGDQQGGEAEQAGQLPVVHVSNYPLEYFVERIAGPVVEVRFPAAVSDDPALWHPTTEDITEMQASALIVLNGASYEGWLENVSLPASRMVETARGFESSWIRLEEATTHSHGQEGEHEHGLTAFTTWLDLELAIEQARALRDALVLRLPDHASHFQDNFSRLEEDLLGIDSEFAALATQAPNTPVLFSHPVYQYFETRYGARARSVHWEPDAMPDEDMWNELEEIQSGHEAQWMLWEGEPLPETVRRLEEMGIQSAVLNPCGNRPETGDFLEVMALNASVLRRIYSE